MTFMKGKAIKRIRARLKLSQAGFAKLLGVSVRTLQDWEQGRHEPRGSAISLLTMADRGLLTKRKR